MTTASAHDPFFIRRFPRLMWRTVQVFFSDNVSRLGAALAFYTTVAVAPMLVLAIGIAGFFFDSKDAARERVLSEIEHLAGEQAGDALKAVQSPANDSAGRIATIISAGTLLFGAFGVFYHLQDALNAIWHVPPPKEVNWWRTLRKRLFSIAMVLVTGFLLLVSLIASAFLSWLSVNTVSRLGLPPLVLQTVNQVISLGMITLLFAVIFRLLPDTHVRWRHVWLGSAFTAVLFTRGQDRARSIPGQRQSCLRLRRCGLADRAPALVLLRRSDHFLWRGVHSGDGSERRRAGLFPPRPAGSSQPVDLARTQRSPGPLPRASPHNNKTAWLRPPSIPSEPKLLRCCRYPRHRLP